MTSGQQGPYTDIYALAATLYVCVSGKEPLSATHRVLSGDAMPSARDIARGDYGQDLLCAIDAGLLLQPEERPQTIAAWREVFATGQWAGLPFADKTIVQPPGRISATVKSTVGSAPRLSRKRLVLGGAVAAVALVGAALWWLGRDHRSQQSLQSQLEAALAKSVPTTTPQLRKETATAFARRRPIARSRWPARAASSAGRPTGRHAKWPRRRCWRGANWHTTSRAC